MLKVGVTGGIGSGKSVVCRVFSKFDIPVYYADIRARILMDRDTDVKSRLIDICGEDIYNEWGLDKKRFANILFNDSNIRRQVNDVVHPAIRQDFLAWAESQDTLYVIEEAALLFESGGYTDMDFNVTVSAPEEIRIKRVSERDGISREDVKSRIDSQMDEAEKIRLADFVIYNTPDYLVVPQILELHNTFINYAKDL